MGSRVRRECGADGCVRPRRSGGRHCREHHAAAVAVWYRRNRRAINARRRDVAAQQPEEAHEAHRARAKVARDLKRGKLRRGACVECGRDEVTAYIADPARWREVVWVCRDCRPAFVERKADEARRQREREEWAQRRERALARFQVLDESERLRVEERARHDPFGLGELTPEAPLYWQRLVREVERAS